MDQYFERLQRLTENEQLPMRIKFLVQDIIDLRRNKWQFRRVGKGPEGPRTIQQVGRFTKSTRSTSRPSPDNKLAVEGFICNL